MMKIIRYAFSFLILIPVFLFIVLKVPIGAVVNGIEITKEEEPSYFPGEGTEEKPYLISSDADLCRLSELVNQGNEFRNQYFEQTQKLDLSSVDGFVPIGKFNSGHYFWGRYNGNGYYIENLNIEEKKAGTGNVALFGQLAGEVRNLGIESGLIQGAYIGSIASHAASSEAKIINCYNKATIKGSGRAGGIVDNFGQGQIINCWNEGKIEAPETGGIVSYSAGLIYNSYSAQGKIKNEYFGGTIIPTEIRGGADSNPNIIVQKMNNGIQSAETFFEFKDDTLMQWKVNSESITLEEKKP